MEAGLLTLEEHNHFSIGIELGWVEIIVKLTGVVDGGAEIRRLGPSGFGQTSPGTSDQEACRPPVYEGTATGPPAGPTLAVIGGTASDPEQQQRTLGWRS